MPMPMTTERQEQEEKNIVKSFQLFNNFIQGNITEGKGSVRMTSSYKLA